MIDKKIDKKSLEAALEFVDSYWSQIIHEAKDSEGDPHIIPLPHAFVHPNANSHWKTSMFYWDTFFIFRGLINTKRAWILPEIVDNYVYGLKPL